MNESLRKDHWTKWSAIILAAGKGSRYKEKKQDLRFHDVPMWEYVRKTVSMIVESNRIVVVGKDVEGGDTRSESVRKGLNSVPQDTSKVVIVEAARPLVKSNQIYQLLDNEYDSVAFVRPLVNTVVYRDGRYVDRNEMYDLLTPQAFNYHLLKEAYDSGNFIDMTDETRVMYEYHNIKPNFIETTNNLYKVTYPGDMEVIKSLELLKDD